MYGNIDIEAIGSVTCSIISMPIWNFGRGVLAFFERPTGIRGVVSLAIRGESVVIILDNWCEPRGGEMEVDTTSHLDMDR